MTLEDQALLSKAADLLPLLRANIEKQQLHKAIEQIWHVIGEANRYVDEQKPWALKTENPARMGTILYVLAETIRQIAILTQPLVPQASARILDQLAISPDQRTFVGLKTALVPGAALPTPEGVFPRWIEGK
jgi:methionyl-tRNA synthetase